LDQQDRAFPAPRVIRLDGFDHALIGDPWFCVIAGPCAVEDRDQLRTVARTVCEAGAGALRGGAFKPRTWRKSFQGLGRGALELLVEARREFGLPVVTEVLDPRDVELVAEHADMLQIGMRNMQNFPLLREVGRCRSSGAAEAQRGRDARRAARRGRLRAR
jgi:3-deoxy-7-phosphoheptulonate synthase